MLTLALIAVALIATELHGCLLIAIKARTGSKVDIVASSIFGCCCAFLFYYFT